MREYRVFQLYSDELKKHKRIYVHLPKDYDNSAEYYPVLYMHDGQNLFDDQTAYHKRSWRIIEELERNEQWFNTLIIVGIESDIDRNDELIPYPFRLKEDGPLYGGRAIHYLDFIVETVKPLIDKRFRTMKDPSNTALMGSSFGGVNSFYAALQYSHVFHRFGCLSNAFHYGFYNPLKELLQRSDLSTVIKLYLDFGTNETTDEEENQAYMTCNKEIYQLIQEKTSKNQSKLVVIDGGKHHERDWQKRFIDVISYIFSN